MCVLEVDPTEFIPFNFFNKLGSHVRLIIELIKGSSDLDAATSDLD